MFTCGGTEIYCIFRDPERLSKSTYSRHKQSLPVFAVWSTTYALQSTSSATCWVMLISLGQRTLKYQPDSLNTPQKRTNEWIAAFGATERSVVTAYSIGLSTESWNNLLKFNQSIPWVTGCLSTFTTIFFPDSF